MIDYERYFFLNVLRHKKVVQMFEGCVMIMLNWWSKLSYSSLGKKIDKYMREVKSDSLFFHRVDAKAPRFGHGTLVPYHPHTEPVFVNLIRSPEIDSRPCGPVQQPYLTYRPAGLHRLAESLPRNRFLGSINVYKYGLSSIESTEVLSPYSVEKISDSWQA